MVESKSIRPLSQTYSGQGAHGDELQQATQQQIGISKNPVPAIVIFLLGIILGGHHQSSMTSTTMHKQVSLAASHSFKHSGNCF